MSNDRNLDDSENMLSMLELSHDFISAGLLDRAEAILLKMVEIPTDQRLLNFYSLFMKKNRILKRQLMWQPNILRQMIIQFQNY